MDVNFKHGLKTNLPKATSPGTLYITSDTGEAYVDFEDSRTQILDSTKFPIEGGNMEGDINMQMHKVYNISEPENPNDAVTLGYLNDVFDPVEKVFTGKPYNILWYGADPTGTTDCSTIINNLLMQGDIYIPSGTYKISNTIVTNSHSIHGDGNSSILVFDNMDIGISCSNGTSWSRAKIESIYLNAANVSESVIDITNIMYYWIHEIYIVNFPGIGININPSQYVSRMVVLSEVFINTHQVTNSIGINFNNYNAHDSRIYNCEIMGCHYGIYTKSSILLNTVHIWFDGRDTTVSTFNSSVGIYADANIIGNIIYIDSFGKYFKLGSTELYVLVDNLMIIDDRFLTDSDSAESYLFDTSDANMQVNHIQITNGTIQYNDKMVSLMSTGTTVYDPRLISFFNIFYDFRYRTKSYLGDPMLRHNVNHLDKFTWLSGNYSAVTSQGVLVCSCLNAGGYLDLSGAISGGGTFELKAWFAYGSGTISPEYCQCSSSFRLGYTTQFIVNDLYLTNIYVVPQQPNYTYYEGSVAVNNQAGNVGINICNLNNSPQTISSSSITLISNT